MELDPESVVTLINLANLHVDLGEDEAAAETFRRARGLAAQNLDLLFAYASWRARCEDTAEAIEVLWQLVTIDPGYHRANHLLGQLLLARGDATAAEALLRRALGTAPNAVDRREIEGLLARDGASHGPS